ncbi:MAG TPA: hypothetical protein VIU15_09325 [Streptomyces sp.]
MAAGSLLLGFAVFFLSPVVPWILFPFRRKTGAAAAAGWGVLAVSGFFVWDGALVASAALTVFSCCVRVIVEMSGTFEEPRARREERRREREQARAAAS